MTTGTTTKPKRILSGIQPSGKLHLGNYFGAIKPAHRPAKRGPSASTSSPTTTP